MAQQEPGADGARNAAPDLGALLRAGRVRMGLTQEALAERVAGGLTVETISNIERGRTRPHRHTLQALLAALRVEGAERAAVLAAWQRRPVPSAARGPVSSVPLPPESVPPAPLLGRERPARRADSGLGPLVGRQREVALLDRLLTGVSAPLLLLAGEPGIGKTRLLQVAEQRAGVQGWSVLAGGCQRRGGQDPYSPLLDALAQHLQYLPPDRVPAALAGCAWLAPLLPELAEALEPLPGGSVSPEQERRLMFAAVTRLLANVAGSAGTLLLLDDLQWANADALDLLASLLRWPSSTPLRVVGAYRDTEVRAADPLGLLLADLAQAGLAHHHALTPLAPDEATALLAGLLPDRTGGDSAAGAGVLERAGGVPFFLVSYAHALQHAGTEGATPAAQAPAVPWTLAQGVRQRVTLLPEAAQVVLGAAAIVGRRAPWALLVAVSGPGEDEVLAGLEAAGRARLLLEDGDDAYVFAHDVIREVVEADLGAARRALLHRRVAEALERAPAGASADLLAYHYRRGGQYEKALLHLERAGDQAAAVFAHHVAEQHYRTALDLARTQGERTREGAALEKLAAVLGPLARYDEALAALDQAADLYRAAREAEGEARVLAQMGRVHSWRGTQEEGLARLQPVVARLEGQGASQGLAALYAALAELFQFTGRPTEELAAVERAADLARAVGDHHLLATAQERWATALIMTGQWDQALPLALDASQAAETLGDLELGCWALADVGIIHRVHGEVGRSAQYLERALQLAERQENAYAVVCLLQLCAEAAFYSCAWGQARHLRDRAEDLSRQTGVSVGPSIPLHRLHLAEGDWERATSYMASDQVRHAATLERNRAELELVQGQPVAARARLRALLAGRQLPARVPDHLQLLAQAHLACGQVGAAARVVARAVDVSRRSNCRLMLLDALRVQALVLLRQERWADAGGVLEEGLALARTLPYPYAEARLQHVSGQLHTQTGGLQEARERLEAALVLFGDLGAHGDAAQAEQALAALAQRALA